MSFPGLESVAVGAFHAKKHSSQHVFLTSFLTYEKSSESSYKQQSLKNHVK